MDSSSFGRPSAGWSSALVHEETGRRPILHPPELAESVLENYNGKAGDVIRVRAIDDVKVTTVGIVIVGFNNTVIEEGRVTQDGIDKTLWSYTATRDANANHVKLLVDIADLPGHITRETVEKDI